MHELLSSRVCVGSRLLGVDARCLNCYYNLPEAYSAYSQSEPRMHVSNVLRESLTCDGIINDD